MTPRQAVLKFMQDRMWWELKYSGVSSTDQDESRQQHHEWWSLFVTLMQCLSKHYGPVDQYRILKELDAHALRVWLTPQRAEWIIDSCIEGRTEPTEWNFWGERVPKSASDCDSSDG